MIEVPAPLSLGSYAPGPQTVLVVDADEGVTTFVAKLLVTEGYAVDIAHDGPSALTAAANNPPDVVLLDVMASSSRRGRAPAEPRAIRAFRDRGRY